jgi:hypothetical protein
MICRYDVLAVNEEPRAVMEACRESHGDERKGEYDEVFHDASVG